MILLLLRIIFGRAPFYEILDSFMHALHTDLTEESRILEPNQLR
jgi:hypothetical protein